MYRAEPWRARGASEGVRGVAFSVGSFSCGALLCDLIIQKKGVFHPAADSKNESQPPANLSGEKSGVAATFNRKREERKQAIGSSSTKGTRIYRGD